MGKFYRPNWDEREKDNDRPQRRVRRRPVSRVYLGYGYYVTHYNDGTKELGWDNTTKTLALSLAKVFTEDGFPIWDEQAVEDRKRSEGLE